MKLYHVCVYLSTIFLLSCSSNLNYIYLESDSDVYKSERKIVDDDYKDWMFKDIIIDTLPGVSLERARKEILTNRKEELSKEVIVAVIDTEIDISHKDFKSKLWKNNKEIIDNSKDDDNNGYVDDMYGWNFLGNSEGKNIMYANFEYVRIIKKYDSIFSEKKIDEVNKNKLSEFLEYEKAKTYFDKEQKESTFYVEQGEIMYKTYQEAHKKLLKYFPNRNYDIKKLDSLGREKTELLQYTSLISKSIKYNVSEQNIIDDIEKYKINVSKHLNLKYDDRKILHDDPSDISDLDYGNNKILKENYILTHGTQMAGIICANFNEQNKIKIMPIPISPRGDEYDKDIALAIRYAVDNGAHIINMSSGKEFSLQKKWVLDALKYASKKNVLFVTSAGNDNAHIDFKSYTTYPNDDITGKGEVIDNFIMVANNTIHLKSLKEESSNYSKIHVDLFAPGTEVYTTTINDNYVSITGTSASSALVSKIAALIKSNYPNLKASEIKHILMESGIAYDIDVEIQQEDGTQKMVPFSSLSKSGKVVNAYNALLMAEEMSVQTPNN